MIAHKTLLKISEKAIRIILYYYSEIIELEFLLISYFSIKWVPFLGLVQDGRGYSNPTFLKYFLLDQKRLLLNICRYIIDWRAYQLNNFNQNNLFPVKWFDQSLALKNCWPSLTSDGVVLQCHERVSKTVRIIELFREIMFRFILRLQYSPPPSLIKT